MLSVEIKKAFPNFVLDVSFEAGNEALALLGASGCGKSMTLKCIAGIVQPDSGRIVLNGRVLFDSQKRINLSPQKRRTGFLFQNYALFPNMTVEENIGTVLRKAASRDKKMRVNELLERFLLTEQRGHYPALLSGGQQQRTALARILASDPDALMLDEPLSALDSFLRWHLEQELISVIEKFPGAALYVSHNRDEVYRLCKKVCAITSGKSETVMTTEEFFTNPQTRSAALLSGCKNFSRAKKTGADRVFALDWGCELECRAVPGGIQYIGVRAHNITPGAARNKISCVIVKVIQDLFGVIVIAAPRKNASADGQSFLRLEMPKSESGNFHAGDAIEPGVLPGDILLLR
jgi:molybdate transport system ATP-binding protein